MAPRATPTRCTPSMAHSLRDESSQRARQGESLAEVARVSTVRWNLKEVIGKALTQRTGSAYKAGVPDKRAIILKVQSLHRRHASRCDGYKCESECVISGEVLLVPEKVKP